MQLTSDTAKAKVGKTIRVPLIAVSMTSPNIAAAVDSLRTHPLDAQYVWTNVDGQQIHDLVTLHTRQIRPSSATSTPNLSMVPPTLHTSESASTSEFENENENEN